MVKNRTDEFRRRIRNRERVDDSAIRGERCRLMAVAGTGRSTPHVPFHSGGMTHGTVLNTAVGRVYRQFCHAPTGHCADRLYDVCAGEALDVEALPWFLALGHLPGDMTLFRNCSCLPGGAQLTVQAGAVQCERAFRYEDLLTDAFDDWTEEQLVREGVHRIKQSVQRFLAQQSSGIVVPISGGMDSRAILGGLLAEVGAKEIGTYTYGTPGSWDFEIGNRVARFAGTRHEAFDLRQYEYTLPRLEDFACRSDASTDLFRHAPYDWIRERLDPEAVFWIGFMGDPSAGSHIPDPQRLARFGDRYVVDKNRFARDDRLETLVKTDRPVPLESAMPTAPRTGSLTPQELWDFYNRQERLVAPVVFPHGYRYATPFLDRDWLAFSLSLPLPYRKGRHLYEKILLAAFPALFALPEKGHLGVAIDAGKTRIALARMGRKVRHVVRRRFFDTPDPRMLNYIDFAGGLRNREDLRTVVRDCLDGLKARELLMNEGVEQRWEAHQAGRADHSRALTLLASLEIVLRVFERAPSAHTTDGPDRDDGR